MLLDREAMAAAISVCAATLDGMRKAGCPQITIPGTKKVLFDPVDVVAWLKEQSVPCTETLAAAKERADVVFGPRRAS
ncbi:MAG: hypothetical protein KJ060_16675 [Candidatus Hydrogenedentes bacterium]|nr:hypothetical protein [Candidatus Hydrogenedentota bacterium]